MKFGNDVEMKILSLLNRVYYDPQFLLINTQEPHLGLPW
jgi:hypothetical protein